MHFVDAKSILSAANGMNLYRGCLHGCIYCDSRSQCYQFQHDFEDIEVKQNAPKLLRDALRKKRKQCMIGTGSMCDPYIPPERDLLLTKQCLEIIAEYEFGAAVLTKSDLILRDLELYRQIAKKQKAVVQMTLTTADDDLCNIIEPNVCPTSRRFEVLCEMREAGIPTVVWLTPLLPYLNDTEENLTGILKLCRKAGVKGIVYFGMGMTLRSGSREYFYRALDQHFPGLRRQYEREFGEQYEVARASQQRLDAVFHKFCEENGLLHRPEDCFRYLRELPEQYTQLSLF